MFDTAEMPIVEATRFVCEYLGLTGQSREYDGTFKVVWALGLPRLSQKYQLTGRRRWGAQ